MRVRSVLVVIAMLAAAPAFAQKIYIEYDQDYDGSNIETFAWTETEGTSLAQTSPGLHSKIVETLGSYIKESGIEQVDDNADVYVTYHGSSKEELSVNTSSMGYGYPSGWGYGAYGGYGGYYGRYYGGVYGGSSTTTVSSYRVGTLVVDIWDAETETLVWRGIAAGIVVAENPRKLDTNIEKAVRKMVGKWRKIKKKNR